LTRAFAQDTVALHRIRAAVRAAIDRQKSR
jgi:uncharacterized protein (DUF924 family)